MLTYSMGGPSIDGGAYSGENADIIRYTPPVPEFEVIMLHVDPGQSLEYENPGVPAILIILEGSGQLDGKLCRPGRSYYWPADAPALQLSVSESCRGSMKVAVAHKNCHLDRPTAVNRDNFGGHSSVRMSTSSTPLPFMGMGGGTPVNASRKEADPSFLDSLPILDGVGENL
jgi:hypothetical protein